MGATPSPVQLLRWYVEAGADEAIGDVPRDRYASAPPAASAAASTTATAREVIRPFPPASPLLPPANQGSAAPAAAAHDLAELRRALERFDGCALKETATTTVFADGNPDSAVMIIGEAPGADEDRQGLPFVGVSGQLLDRMLASIGLDRTSVYITNVLPWRPPGNRKPTLAEVASCVPFLERHIVLVNPKFLLLLGGMATSVIFARPEGIMRLRGRWHDYAVGLARPIPALATFHPAYLLRTPAQKKFAWRDFLALKRRLDSLPQEFSQS
ncbi:MAG: uracil-DNA glycosylase family protein [Alphaproteobacteria bacterium]